MSVVEGSKTYRRGGNIVTNNGVSTGSLVSIVAATNTRSRASDPNYRVKIAKRQDASLPYTRKSYSLEQPLMYSSSRRKDGSATSSAVTASLSWSPASTIPNNTQTMSADDIALKRLKSKLANDQGQFKALVPLAELRETYGLLGQVMDASSGLLKSLIELKQGRVRNVVSAASKAWLTFSFGVSPTINDLNSAYSSINSYLARADYCQDYRGKAECEWFSTNNNLYPTAACSGFNWNTVARTYHHKYQVQYTAGVRMNIRSANNYGIPDHFGLDFAELPSTLWELIPFSWVVDYFTTTGDFLSDTFTSNAGNTIYCCKSVKYNEHAEEQLVLTNISSVWEQTGGVGQVAKADSFLFQRSVLAAIPHRSFRFKTQSEIGVNSVNRLLNLASILLS